MPDEITDIASTQYNDWMGTAAFDDPHEELATDVLGIDPDRWHVLGISVFGGWGDYHRAIAFAVDRTQLRDGETFDDLAARSGGKLPVVELTDLRATARDIFDRFKQFSVVVWANGESPGRTYDMERTETRSLGEDSAAG